MSIFFTRDIKSCDVIDYGVRWCHMTKEFLIAGTDWVTEVTIETKDNETVVENMRVEAATRAIEGRFGKRDDMEFHEYDGIFEKDNTEPDELQRTLFELVHEELEPGCKVGCLLAIAMKDDKELYFINSKIVLQNAGFGKLAKIFDKKYPDSIKKEKTA